MARARVVEENGRSLPCNLLFGKSLVYGDESFRRFSSFSESWGYWALFFYAIEIFSLA
jgi:hypothetical protein